MDYTFVCEAFSKWNKYYEIPQYPWLVVFCYYYLVFRVGFWLWEKKGGCKIYKEEKVGNTSSTPSNSNARKSRKEPISILLPYGLRRSSKNSYLVGQTSENWTPPRWNLSQFWLIVRTMIIRTTGIQWLPLVASLVLSGKEKEMFWISLPKYIYSKLT